MGALRFQEGDLANSIFQVGEGMVMLYQLLPDGRRQVVEVRHAGDVFGFSGGPVRDCTAETLMPTSCAMLDRSDVGLSDASAQRLNAGLFAQLRRLHEHVTLLDRKSATEYGKLSDAFHSRPLPRRVSGATEGRGPGPRPAADDAAGDGRLSGADDRDRFARAYETQGARRIVGEEAR